MGSCVLLVVVTLAYFSPQLIAVNDESILSNARYACGIRKRFGVELFHEDHKAELGQWPWHAALFEKNKYTCGGTLIDQKHVLTAAHCVFENVKSNSTHLFRVYLGLRFLDGPNHLAQKTTVSEVHLRFKHQDEMLHNDIALLELSDIVQYSEFVIPICLVGSQIVKAEDLMGKRGWVPGWGGPGTKTDEFDSELKMAQMLVGNNTMCIRNDLDLFGPYVSPAMLCARPINGTSICTGYGGGGMYFLAGDHWELRGIVSFSRNQCGIIQYMAFTNVPFYFEWIKGLTKGTLTREDISPKRLSEQKCQEYRKFAKNLNEICLNTNSPHTVAIIDRSQRLISSGSIISEKFVLTKAPNLVDIFELDVEWNDLKVRVFQQLDKDILNYLHPHYNTETHRHHVMLLELKTPLIFTSGLLPACLANDETENLNDILLLNGYTDLNSNVYERNDSKVIKSEICNSSVQSINWKYSINVEEFCTIFKTDESPSRSGIVGGALQTLNTRSCMYTIVGITKQLLHDNIEYKYINVFSRVVNYLDWIEEVVWGKGVVLKA